MPACPRPAVLYQSAPFAPMTLVRALLQTLLLPLLLSLLLTACSGSDDPDQQRPTQAELAGIGAVLQAPGASVFIARVSIELANYADLAGVDYAIAPRPGTLSRPLAVGIERSWLERRGAYDPASRRLALPVFGLYAAHANAVDMTLRFRDGSRHALRVDIVTSAYVGPGQVYTRPELTQARSRARPPGFDFILLKNGITSPVVIDTDGHMRWASTQVGNSFTSMFDTDAFYVGSLNTPELYRMELDGGVKSVRLGPSTGGVAWTWFHHDLAPGKTGMLAELDAVENGVAQVEDILVEIDTEGKVLREWDLGRIFAAYMRAQGDDPSNFVRDGRDWFHMNSAIYDPADDSLLISSRENFVVKLDYDSGAIRWLLGDTAKHWYVNYPSLRALALRVVEGKAPIGQHALSLTPDGELLLFNNGLRSLNQPLGAPTGATRPYSTPSRYRIDEQSRTAREVWTWEGERRVFSDVCSSVYEAGGGSLLVAYSALNARSTARLLGVDGNGQVAFEFSYPTADCNTFFMAQPLDWANLRLR